MYRFEIQVEFASRVVASVIIFYLVSTLVNIAYTTPTAVRNTKHFLNGFLSKTISFTQHHARILIFNFRFSLFELPHSHQNSLKKIDGFLSIERFESVSNPGRYVSLSFWRDEEAVRQWRNLQQHREAQAKGRGGIFAAYRLRVAQVLRDYTMEAREQAPEDSRKIHK